MAKTKEEDSMSRTISQLITDESKKREKSHEMLARRAMSTGGIVLFAGGSFNPPTYMHLRIFERARDHLRAGGHTVVEGVMSPTADGYQRLVNKHLAPAAHRLKMCQLAVQSSSWIRVDGTECGKASWSRTLPTLREARERLVRAASNGLAADAPEPRALRLMFLCGADLVESFARPDLWRVEDVEQICRDFGLVVITRAGTDPLQFIAHSQLLTKYKENIHVVPEIIANEISSTVVRQSLARGESVRYLVPDAVLDYIYAQALYAAVPPSSLPPRLPPTLCHESSGDSSLSEAQTQSSAGDSAEAAAPARQRPRPREYPSVDHHLRLAPPSGAWHKRLPTNLDDVSRAVFTAPRRAPPRPETRRPSLLAPLQRFRPPRRSRSQPAETFFPAAPEPAPPAPKLCSRTASLPDLIARPDARPCHAKVRRYHISITPETRV